MKSSSSYARAPTLESHFLVRLAELGSYDEILLEKLDFCPTPISNV